MTTDYCSPLLIGPRSNSGRPLFCAKLPQIYMRPKPGTLKQWAVALCAASIAECATESSSISDRNTNESSQIKT